MASITPNLVNDDFTDAGTLTTWAVGGVDGGAVSLVGHTIRMLNAGSSISRCQGERNLVSDNNFTIEVRVILDVLGTTIDNGLLYECGNGITYLQGAMYNGKLYVSTDGTTYTEVGTNLSPAAEYHTWRFEVTGGTAATATVNIYKDDVQVGTNIDCSVASTSTRRPFFQLRGYTTATDCHIDWVKIGTGLGDFKSSGGFFNFF